MILTTKFYLLVRIRYHQNKVYSYSVTFLSMPQVLTPNKLTIKQTDFIFLVTIYINVFCSFVFSSLEKVSSHHIIL